MKNNFAIYFIAISLITAAVSEDCDKCTQKENCPPFLKLNQEAQDAWQAKFPCANPEDKDRFKIFGFASTAKGDYVCCSNAIWGTSGSSKSNETDFDQSPSVNGRHSDFNTNYGRHNNYDDPNSDYFNTRTPRNTYGYDNDRYNSGSNSNQYPNNGGFYNNGNNNNVYNGHQGNPQYGYDGRNTQSPPKNYFNVNNNPYATPSPFFPVNRPGNNVNEGGQCPITSFPPEPETGCCGREATDSDRIIGHQPGPNPPTNTPNNGYNNWTPNSQNPTARNPQSSGYMSWPYGRPSYPNFGSGLNRVTRSANSETVNVTIDDRIAGGRETELEQFPWTALLRVNFDYGSKRAAFNCGGSLISSRYVLTAGHCVYEEGATVMDVDVFLAEYDKRTFPKDCKNVLGQGQKCIENVVIKSEEVLLHPQYEDSQLKNDIALIRLADVAPYTDYIRPICLPSIDIDSPNFSNLRLAVVGWGRNGRYRSDVKQSTIVNLVPQEKCSESYPGLSRRNLCAAGYTGQDTCKGDSGGPLMTVYGGKFQVVGVVSGKRADSPCGTSVPSLYTSVYHYIDWIKSTIRN